MCRSFGSLNLGFVSDLDIRISNFKILWTKQTSLQNHPHFPQ